LAHESGLAPVIEAINLARASGETLQDIGSAAGVSAERIRQIVSEKS
jgi:DNA-directed RNA polymerase sigma subunit (sigma70/sigma32)